jgi:uncharacterized membrane protein required for colicin V production/N-acetylneuraminic acid mutarotase
MNRFLKHLIIVSFLTALLVGLLGLKSVDADSNNSDPLSSKTNGNLCNIQDSSDNVFYTYTLIWHTKTPMPAARRGAAAGIIDGVFCVAGGLNGTDTSTLQAYNAATDKWITLSPMPAGRYQGDGAGVIDGRLYIAGGWDNTYSYLPHRELFVYDPVTNVWSSMASMPVLSAYGATGVINGKLYVTTAADGNNGFRNFLHVYNPLTNSWSSLASSPIVHSSPACGVINNKIYVVGGYDGTKVTNQLDVYDPATNTWSTKTPMPIAGQEFASVVYDHKLYVMGGETNTPYSSSVYIYDPDSDRWTIGESLLTEHRGAVAGVINNAIYVVGGVNSNGVLATVESFSSTIETPVKTQDSSVVDTSPKSDDNTQEVTSYHSGVGFSSTDVLIIVILFLGMMFGAARGFTLSIFGLAGIALGLKVAGLYYSTIGNWLGFLNNATVANIIGYIIICLGIMLLAAVIGTGIKNLLSVMHLTVVDHIIGLFSGFVLAAIICALLFFQSSGNGSIHYYEFEQSSKIVTIVFNNAPDMMQAIQEFIRDIPQHFP